MHMLVTDINYPRGVFIKLRLHCDKLVFLIPEKNVTRKTHISGLVCIHKI